MEFKRYRFLHTVELADWTPDIDMTDVYVSEAEKAAGSPREGDKIARSPSNHDDKWLITRTYFATSIDPNPV